MDELGGIVERDAILGGAMALPGQFRYAEQAVADRRYLLGLLRECREALLSVEKPPTASERALLARLAALGERP